MKTGLTRLIMLVAIVMAVAASSMERSLAAGAAGPPLKYHGGRVMPGTTNVYFILYGSWTGDTTPDILADFIVHIGGSPYMNINTTYPDGGGGRPSGFLVYGGSVADQYSHGASLSETDVEEVVIGQISNGQFPLDPNGIYFVFASSDVNATGFCTQVCQFHQHTTITGTNVIYAFVGNPARCPLQCASQFVTSSPNGNFVVTPTPNDNLAADAMVSWVAHVLSGALTNPTFQGWFDNRGRENSDKCVSQYGTTYVVANGAHANVRLAAFATPGFRDYLIQENWVNAHPEHCALSFP
jgi:hypothetical protein